MGCFEKFEGFVGCDKQRTASRNALLVFKMLQNPPSTVFEEL
jgi:hypothetical protein